MVNVSKIRRWLSHLRKSKRGSLLLEALVVIVILSAGLTVIIQSLLSCLHAVAYGADFSRAAFLADNKMFNVLVVKNSDTGLSEEGTFSSPFEGYRYEIQEDAKKKEDGETVEDPLRKVRLTISWPSGRGDRDILVETYISDPVQDKK